jgi:hypothetical protein
MTFSTLLFFEAIIGLFLLWLAVGKFLPTPAGMI